MEKLLYICSKKVFINRKLVLVMALLKEDGSLDAEKIRNLPFEEYIKEYNKLDEGQINEYWSQIPLNESATPERSKEIDLYVANNGVVAMAFLNKMIEKYGHRK